MPTPYLVALFGVTQTATTIPEFEGNNGKERARLVKDHAWTFAVGGTLDIFGAILGKT